MTNKKAIALVLGIMCFALTTGICIQVKTVKNTNSTSSKNYEENNLRAEVLKYKEKYDTVIVVAHKMAFQSICDCGDMKPAEIFEATFK